MRLTMLFVENFCGFEQRTEINTQSFSVLVGRNDVGKSSILKALDLFLNDKSPSPETSNLYSPSKETIIEAVFFVGGRKIIIDETIETTFEDEELVDKDGYVRIKKVWDTSQTKPKPQVSIYRKKYGNNDFIFATESQLIKLCQTLSLQTQKANGEQYNNAEKRLKLRTLFSSKEVPFEYVWEKLPSTGSNRQRDLLEVIKASLPRFEFFRADTSLSESDTSIQNYFRDIATESLKKYGMGQAEKEVRNQLGFVLNSITEKINAAMPAEGKVRPEIEFDWSKVVKTSFITGDENVNVPLSLRGDGFRRVTMMAYFEHLAEEKCETNREIIFGFEEPETYLHPKAQEQLFEKLRGMAGNGYQVLISTHSSVIVSNSKQLELIHVSKNNGRSMVTQPVMDIMAVANDLGITLNNQFIRLFDKAKVLLLVEGIDDAIAYQYVAQKYKECNEIDKTFEDMDIVLLPIGGCGSIKHWVTLDLLRKLTKPYFILLDSDIDSAEKESLNEKSLIELGFIKDKLFRVTRKRNLENYIPCAALNRIVPGANLNYGHWDNVKDLCKVHPLAGQLGGKNVAEKHFSKLTFNDLKSSFCDISGQDEFIEIYNLVRSLVSI